MAIAEIIKNPANEILRKMAKNVGTVDRQVSAILENMTDTLRFAGGNGLAAPQIGVSLRLIVIKNDANYIRLINPAIQKSEGEQISPEGCLSLPGIYCLVRRPEYIVLKALDINGKSFEMKAMHRRAAVLSHELDHLDGVLMIDKAIRIVNYNK